MHLWPNLLGVFYPMPLGGRIASVINKNLKNKNTINESWHSKGHATQVKYEY